MRAAFRKYVKLFEGNEWAAIVWSAIGGAAFGVILLILLAEAL